MIINATIKIFLDIKPTYQLARLITLCMDGCRVLFNNASYCIVLM